MTTPNVDPFEAAYSSYLTARNEFGTTPPGSTVANIDLQAVAESGYPLPQVLLGALVTGRRLMATAETGDTQIDLQRAGSLQDAAGFLERHWPTLGGEVEQVIGVARGAGAAVMTQVASETREMSAAPDATELPLTLRQAMGSMKPGTLYGYRAFSRIAADLPGSAGPTFGYYGLMSLLNTVYNTEGAPPAPADIFQSIVNPLMGAGILEMASRRKGAAEYRLVSPAGRDQQPTRNRPGIPARIHISPAEALILAAQLNRLESELVESDLPTIEPELVTALAERVESGLRMDDSQLLEARRLLSDKIGRLRTAPRFLLLLKESIPDDDPRQRLFNYIATLPAGGMRLFRGYVGESATAVTFAEIRTAIERGVGPVVGEIEVRRDIT